MNNKPDLAKLFGANSSNTFLGLKSCQNFETIDASSAFIGAPCVTPYKAVGPYARNGPDSIRNASSSLSANIDRYNFDIDGPLFPSGTKKAVDCGNIEWDENDFKKNRTLVKNIINKIIKNGVVPILVGGDDSVPIPMIEAFETLGDNYTILQIDAHIDWKKIHMDEKFGLSSTMRRASEMNHIKKIIQVGARGIGSGSPSDYEDALSWGVQFYSAEKFHVEGNVNIINSIDNNSNVIICVDIDSMDPSITPNTIGRSPGGLNYFQVLGLIKSVSNKAKIKAIDFVEIMPEVDIDGIGGLTVSRLIAATMGIIAKNNL